jgi:putative MATE family efflux protein
MENKKTLEMFTTMPVPKAVVKNATPAMTAMIMVLIYNLADTFFVGQTNDALQVAAVSIVTPVFLIFMAVGTVFGIGGTSIISRAMGEGRKEYARKVSAFCMWSCVIVGVIMSALFLIFMEQILSLVGTSSGTWEYAKSYLTIVSFCGPFVLIGNCYSNILRAEGQATKAMMGMLLGNLLSVILDPIMILSFGWGITGAAIATVIGNIVEAMYYILYFLRGKSTLSISIRDFTVKDKVCSGVLSIGIPASLGSLLKSVSSIIINSQMVAYGDMAVAGVGVAMKILRVTGMLCIGLGQGVQPLLGYCVGAKTWERFKQNMKVSLLFALLLGCSLTGLCYLFTNQLVHAFLTETNAFGYGVQFTKILLTTSTLFGIFYVIVNAIQAMGAAVSSLIINLSRQGIIYIPALFILKSLFGAVGLVWAQPVADILSIGLAVLLYFATIKKMMQQA